MIELLSRLGRLACKRLPFLMILIAPLEVIFYYIASKINIPEQYILVPIVDEVGRNLKIHMPERLRTTYINCAEKKYQLYIKSLITDNMVIYDLGADIGYFTLLFAGLAGTGTVYAFEPNVNTYEYLTKNIHINKYTNIKTYQKAVCEKNGVALFNISVLARASALAYPESEKIDKPASYRYPQKTVSVETITLDSFVFDLRNPAPDFIKMDIEGSEVFALKGMQKLIAVKKPILAIALHNLDIAMEVVSILNDQYTISAFSPEYRYQAHPNHPKLSPYNITSGNDSIVCVPR